eukprot:2902884-Pyramimonas_sp.AAC.1
MGGGVCVRRPLSSGVYEPTRTPMSSGSREAFLADVSQAAVDKRLWDKFMQDHIGYNDAAHLACIALGRGCLDDAMPVSRMQYRVKKFIGEHHGAAAAANTFELSKLIEVFDEFCNVQITKDNLLMLKTTVVAARPERREPRLRRLPRVPRKPRGTAASASGPPIQDAAAEGDQAVALVPEPSPDDPYAGMSPDNV